MLSILLQTGRKALERLCFLARFMLAVPPLTAKLPLSVVGFSFGFDCVSDRNRLHGDSSA